MWFSRVVSRLDDVTVAAHRAFQVACLLPRFGAAHDHDEQNQEGRDESANESWQGACTSEDLPGELGSHASGQLAAE